jgi:hypothetical protein
MPRRVAPGKSGKVGITDEELEIFMPQLDAAWKVIDSWPLGQPMKDMAALIVLKVIAVTSKQLDDVGVYGRLERRATGVRDEMMEKAYADKAAIEFTDDCGFF